MSDGDLKIFGDIDLHDLRAIGLQLDRGNIDLHPVEMDGWLIGIRLNVDTRHFRAEGNNSGNMVLQSLELRIPGEQGGYTGRIEGWDYYKQSGYTKMYKPGKCQLLPENTDFTTFEWLDSHEEDDPYYYFGWGFRTDHIPPYGYRRWTNVAYLGVNYPIQDYFRPGWENVPPAAELDDLMKEECPLGQWTVCANISGFIVDPNVQQDSYLLIRVTQGHKRYHKGVLDFMKSGDKIVGESGADLSGMNWGSIFKPGELELMTGGGQGNKFRVTAAWFTGPDPPSGFPANTWVIRTHPEDPSPAVMGASLGDEYILRSPFQDVAYSLVHFYEEYSPGTYPPQEHVFTFNPIL